MKKILFIIIFACCASSAFSFSLRNKIVFGGTLGLAYYHNQMFQIGFRPSVGYDVTRFFTVGILGTYYYTQYFNFTPELSVNTFGLGGYSRFSFLEMLRIRRSTDFFIQVSYERLWHDFSRPIVGSDAGLVTTTLRNDLFYAGAGISRSIGPLLRFIVILSLDIIQTSQTGRVMPVLRMGVEF